MTTQFIKVRSYSKNETQEDFCQCLQCSRVYWQGTHWGNVQEILDKTSR
ncbi:Mut7-C RNAse domain-containing protein [Candidatus Omnitrophota bacterium]